MPALIDISIGLGVLFIVGYYFYKIIAGEKDKDLRRREEDIKKKDQEIERLKKELDIFRGT